MKIRRTGERFSRVSNLGSEFAIEIGAKKSVAVARWGLVERVLDVVLIAAVAAAILFDAAILPGAASGAALSCRPDDGSPSVRPGRARRSCSHSNALFDRVV